MANSKKMSKIWWALIGVIVILVTIFILFIIIFVTVVDIALGILELPLHLILWTLGMIASIFAAVPVANIPQWLPPAYNTSFLADHASYCSDYPSINEIEGLEFVGSGFHQFAHNTATDGYGVASLPIAIYKKYALPGTDNTQLYYKVGKLDKKSQKVSFSSGVSVSSSGAVSLPKGITQSKGMIYANSGTNIPSVKNGIFNVKDSTAAAYNYGCAVGVKIIFNHAFSKPPAFLFYYALGEGLFQQPQLFPESRYTALHGDIATLQNQISQLEKEEIPPFPALLQNKISQLKLEETKDNNEYLFTKDLARNWPEYLPTIQNNKKGNKP